MEYKESNKSTVEEIRARFDNDVERFSNLDTGQVTTIDAALSLELITEAARSVNPNAKDLLDIGCGAGNYSLKMLQKVPDLACTLVDLSQPMLVRAKERVAGATFRAVETIQADIREVEFSKAKFDIVLAGAVLHHLRSDDEWESVSMQIHDSLRPGGSFWISDLITHDAPGIKSLFWNKYGEYLEGLNGSEFRDKVLQYVDKEDTPRSLPYQLELLKKVGFSKIEILHKNSCFAAFGGIKSSF